MFQPWQCTLRVTQHEAKILLVDPPCDLLKARLDPRPKHPRALLTLLEGLSLWQGQPLRVALSVDESCRNWLGSTLLGDELWPTESLLVRFSTVLPGRRRRVNGVGDFRHVRKLSRGYEP